jgi:hypothetical protein
MKMWIRKVFALSKGLSFILTIILWGRYDFVCPIGLKDDIKKILEVLMFLKKHLKTRGIIRWTMKLRLFGNL